MKLDVITLMQRLLALGYTHPTKRVRSFGGSFALISPCGRLVWEKEFQKELENDFYTN